jgi:hypothetical protein
MVFILLFCWLGNSDFPQREPAVPASPVGAGDEDVSALGELGHLEKVWPVSFHDPACAYRRCLPIGGDVYLCGFCIHYVSLCLWGFLYPRGSEVFEGNTPRVVLPETLALPEQFRSQGGDVFQSLTSVGLGEDPVQVILQSLLVGLKDVLQQLDGFGGGGDVHEC